MTPFQLIVVPLLLALAGRSVYRAWKPGARRRTALLSCVVWIVAAACVMRPETMTQVATRLGIGRGTDLVLYLFCLAFLILAFYGYNRLERITSDITQLVRHLALRNPVSGPKEADPNRPAKAKAASHGNSE